MRVFNRSASFFLLVELRSLFSWSLAGASCTKQRLGGYILFENHTPPKKKVRYVFSPAELIGENYF